METIDKNTFKIILMLLFFSSEIDYRIDVANGNQLFKQVLYFSRIYINILCKFIHYPTAKKVHYPCQMGL